MTIKPCLFLILIQVCCLSAAHADFVPTPKEDLPDLLLSGVKLTGAGAGAAHSFKLGTAAPPPVSLKLGPGKWLSVDLCEYVLELSLLNGGPARYLGQSGPMIGVDVAAQFPDGSAQNSSGAIACPAAGGDGTLKPGAGCAAKETVALASGTTKLKWTLDSYQRVTEYSEANNVNEIDLVVPSPCAAAAAAVPSGQEGAGQTDGTAQSGPATGDRASNRAAAIGQSRDSLKRLTQFQSPVRAMTRAVSGPAKPASGLSGPAPAMEPQPPSTTRP